MITSTQPVDTLVEIPRNLRTVAEVDDVLARMKTYGEQRGCTATVLHIQNRQLGSIADIVSKEEAQQELTRTVTAIMGEIPLKAYSKDDYKMRKDELGRQNLQSYKAARLP